jgi:flavin-dependent dehydrogenase
MKGRVVIGAGIAGLSSALHLAKSDIKTTVFEQNNFIGCGGDNFQAVRNYDVDYDFLDYLIKQGCPIKNSKAIYKIVKYSPSGKSMTVSSDGKPLFYVLRRGPSSDSLDMQLYKYALDSGVKFNFNEKRTLSSADIVASGPIFRNIWGYGAVFEGVDVDERTIHLFMDNNYAPKGGYIYAIPFGKDKLTVASTTFDLNSPLPFLFEKFIKENKIVSDLIQSAYKKTYFGGYAYSNVPLTAQIKGVKFVGCAAGFVEAARGFGIKYAIQSGNLAANSLIENKNYDILWKSEFGEELEKGLKRRLFFEKLSNADLEKMILVDKVKVSEYIKIPSVLIDSFKKIGASSEINDWRKKFSIERLF